MFLHRHAAKCSPNKWVQVVTRVPYKVLLSIEEFHSGEYQIFIIVVVIIVVDVIIIIIITTLSSSLSSFFWHSDCDSNREGFSGSFSHMETKIPSPPTPLAYKNGKER